jgi:hypothetical protein
MCETTAVSSLYITACAYTKITCPASLYLTPKTSLFIQEGNSEEENNGYVVFK